MRTSKAKAKQNPGFIPLNRCQYKLVDHRQLEEPDKAAPFLDVNEEATRQVSQIEPTYIDTAIRAPKDQLEEEEERDAAREAAKAIVIRPILVLRAVAEAKARIEQKKQEHQRLTEEVEAAYAKAYSGYDEDEALLFIEDLDDYRIIVTGNTYLYRDRLKELGGSWHKKAQGWVYPKRIEGELKKELSDLLLKDTNLARAERTKNWLCAYPGCPLPGSITSSTMHETGGEASWYCRYHFISLHAMPSPSAAPSPRTPSG
jgi:hypothetical protein